MARVYQFLASVVLLILDIVIVHCNLDASYGHAGKAAPSADLILSRIMEPFQSSDFVNSIMSPFSVADTTLPPDYEIDHFLDEAALDEQSQCLSGSSCSVNNNDCMNCVKSRNGCKYLHNTDKCFDKSRGEASPVISKTPQECTKFANQVSSMWDKMKNHVLKKTGNDWREGFHLHDQKTFDGICNQNSVAAKCRSKQRQTCDCDETLGLARYQEGSFVKTVWLQPGTYHIKSLKKKCVIGRHGGWTVKHIEDMCKASFKHVISRTALGQGEGCTAITGGPKSKEIETAWLNKGGVGTCFPLFANRENCRSIFRFAPDLPEHGEL